MTDEAESIPSPEDMIKMLWAHADGAAERALEQLGTPLCSNNLSTFLSDDACLRFSTSLLYTEEGLENGQFAQPFFYTEGESRCCKLHIHPRYKRLSEAIPYLVAYMVAPINYGEVADSELCEHLGSMLVKVDRETFYQEICRLADWRPSAGDNV
tara:strand:+ start:528 stop:992 length:465 start_codon:yes stop_codon:yes gene_type:complete